MKTLVCLLLLALSEPGAYAFGRSAKSFDAVMTTHPLPGGVGIPKDCQVIKDLNDHARDLVSDIEDTVERIMERVDTATDPSDFVGIRADLDALDNLNRELEASYPITLDQADRVLEYRWEIPFQNLGVAANAARVELVDLQEYLDKLNLAQLYAVVTTQDSTGLTITIQRRSSPVNACLSDNRFSVRAELRISVQGTDDVSVPVLLQQKMKHWYWPF